MRYLRTEKPRSFHLRPFIVLTITKHAHYKAERETTCSVNVLKLVSPSQPDLQQLWGQSSSKPNALSLRERTPQVGYFCAPRRRSSLVRVRGEVVPHTHINRVRVRVRVRPPRPDREQSVGSTLGTLGDGPAGG